jgi:subtilisin
MRGKQCLIFLTFILLFAACKKETSTSVAEDPDHVCAQQRAAADGSIIEGQYIAGFDSSSSTDLSGRGLRRIAEDVLQRNNIDKESLRQTFAGTPSGFIVRLSAEEVKRLRDDKKITALEPDRIIALDHCFTIAEPRLITWNINRVGYGDGRGKTAWIIDSGIDFGHPDLNTDVTRSRSFLTGISSAADENGHGTHVAGIIGAKNNSIGILGVATEATLISLRVLDKNGEGTLSSIVQALAYVSLNARAGDAVNMSVGGDAASEILDQQVRNTAARGIFISIAAGNDRKPAGNFSPGRANGANIYTVSAVDSLDRFAVFSNYGNDVVDFAAPGVRILSSWLNNRYAFASGTSMAAPHVAGLLLLRGNNISSSGLAKNDPDGIADVIAHY